MKIDFIAPRSMKKLLLLSLAGTLALTGCSLFGGGETGKNGELTGVMDRPGWDSPQPLGTNFIPAGSFHMGQNDQDVNYSQIAHTRQVTVSAFYMDDTEITNNEYRQFIESTLGGGGGGNYLADAVQFLDNEYNYVPPKPIEQVIMPDTLSWVKDFSFTYNEPYLENYWSHPGFDNYPVVGVNWYAAQTFCYWRTQIYNEYRATKDLAAMPSFRLPSEAEWEYAARGGYENKLYPWEGLYLRNARGCFLANFKNHNGDYIGDNFTYTNPSKSYWPNDYGLFDMSGNVAEWCEDDFSETAYTYTFDANPVFRDPSGSNPRRVLRGGSWKDVGYFLSVGTRDYEYADTAKAFIGFRCVVSVIGI